jgi:hypothetical protein
MPLPPSLSEKQDGQRRAALVAAAVTGNEAAFEALWAEGARFTPSKEDPDGLSVAQVLMEVVRGGHGAMLERLASLEEVQFKRHDQWTLNIALSEQNETMVTWLLPHVSDEARCRAMVSCASDHRPLALVQRLLDTMEDQASRKHAIQQTFEAAAQSGHGEVLDGLWSKADPNHNAGAALRAAVACGHLTLMDRLIPVTDLASVRERYLKRREWDQLEKLGLRVPEDVAEDWVKRSKSGKMPKIQVRLRKEKAQELMPERPRPRRLRS